MSPRFTAYHLALVLMEKLMKSKTQQLGISPCVESSNQSA